MEFQYIDFREKILSGNTFEIHQDSSLLRIYL